MNTITKNAVSFKSMPQKYFHEKFNVRQKSFLKTKIYKDDNSLFIPMLPSFLVNEEKIRNMIEDELVLGKVKRIDLVTKQNSNNRYMAFIHFEYWYDDYYTKKFRDIIKTVGQMDVYGYQECIRQSSNSAFSMVTDDIVFTDWNNRKSYAIFIPTNEEYSGVYVPTQDFYNNASVYIRFMMNNTPIPETELNQHQLANNLALAEKEILDLKTRVAQLEEIINKLTTNTSVEHNNP